MGSYVNETPKSGYLHVTIANLLLSLAVKEFGKYVNIWWSYKQEYSVLFLSDSQCTRT